MLAIVDYGVGNLGSIVNMCKKAGANAQIVTQPEMLKQADKLILPGVGAFDAGMQRLEQTGLIPQLNQMVLEQKIPVLGICLGMQLMTLESQEGNRQGLGWIQAKTVRFQSKEPGLKIPQMGWNYIRIQRVCPLVRGLDENSRFYFVHSYYVRCQNVSDVVMSAHYGEEFVCAFEVENIMGVQFHPEKSHRFGLTLFENFIAL